MIPTTRFVADNSVLIVDESEESREVLRTALERRGYTIHEAEAADNGLELAKQHSPRVIVLDADTEDGPSVSQRYDQCSQSNDSHLVVLGSAKRLETPTELRHNVSKPYHYGPLILKIEALLQQSQSNESKNDSSGSATVHGG